MYEAKAERGVRAVCRDEHTETRGGNTRRMICSLRQNDHTNCPCNKPYDAAGLQPNTCTHARTSGQGRKGACREALTLDNLYKKMPRPLAAGKLGSLVVRHLKGQEKKKKESGATETPTGRRAENTSGMPPTRGLPFTYALATPIPIKTACAPPIKTSTQHP